VIDPQGSREAKPTASPPAKKAPRSKRGRTQPTVVAEPTLASRVLEQISAGAGSKAGKPPRWLTLGIGDRLAMAAERRNPYYKKLQRDAFELSQSGWRSKAEDALGGQLKIDDERAVGFAVVRWLASKNHLNTMTKELLAGGEKLDDAIARVFDGGSREQFLSEIDPANAAMAEPEGEMEGAPDFFLTP
jgi:hypothetical protein